MDSMLMMQLCETISMLSEHQVMNFPTERTFKIIRNSIMFNVEGEIILLAVRALTNFVDIFASYGSTLLADPELCAKLLQMLQNIEYMDVAEQVLALFLKLSVDYPIYLWKVVRGVDIFLAYTDFFSLSVQKDILVIVGNLLKKVPVDKMDTMKQTVPHLKNLLLTYGSDPSMSERVCTCFSNIFHSLSYNFLMKPEGRFALSILEEIVEIDLLKALINISSNNPSLITSLALLAKVSTKIAIDMIDCNVTSLINGPNLEGNFFEIISLRISYSFSGNSS
jgi:hypothetical protein